MIIKLNSNNKKENKIIDISNKDENILKSPLTMKQNNINNLSFFFFLKFGSSGKFFRSLTLRNSNNNKETII